jgi:hydrogenase nickel incorporation protein HypB
VDVHESLLASNRHRAAHLRAHFREEGVTTLNLMGSPGAGKTALLEATARALRGGQRLTAVSGDLATTHDADRLERAGIRAETITTGTGCHLEAGMIDHVFHHGDFGAAIRASDYFFIENVGNLVCPAIYDLGQAVNVVALSLTEGVDKPLKYPVMFKNADLVVLTKLDLLPYLPGVSLAAIADALARVMPRPRSIALSVVSGEGVSEWASWLEALRPRGRLKGNGGAPRRERHLPRSTMGRRFLPGGATPDQRKARGPAQLLRELFRVPPERSRGSAGLEPSADHDASRPRASRGVGGLGITLALSRGMQPEKKKQEKRDSKPVAEPARHDQVGRSQPNQSLWDATKEGRTIEPPPDAVPKQDPDRQK